MRKYLLPWWRPHHRTIFDHGIMINYNSTYSIIGATLISTGVADAGAPN
jgi:hypothetical protein